MVEVEGVLGDVVAVLDVVVVPAALDEVVVGRTVDVLEAGQELRVESH